MQVPTGAMLAAGIAATASLLGLIITKGQKISEFRQAWIDGLRNDVSTLLSRGRGLRAAYLMNLPQSELWEAVHRNLVEINEAANRVRLRLNTRDNHYEAIEATLKEMEEVFNSPLVRNTPSPELDTVERRLVSLVRCVLKDEWEVVKRGDLMFRGAKYVSAILTAVSLITLVAYMLASLGIRTCFR